MRVYYNDFERKIKKELLTSAKKIDNESIVRILLAHTDLIRPAAVAIVEKGRWLDEDTWLSPSSQYRVQMMRDEANTPTEATPAVKGYANLIPNPLPEETEKVETKTKRTRTKK